MRPKEAAAFVGKSVKTLSNLRAQRKGPSYMKYAGGEVVYDEAELERWRESLVVERVRHEA